jgi:translocation and assembly module TamB
MRRFLVVAGIMLVLLVGAGGALLYHLLNTERGLQRLLSQLDRVPGLGITVAGASGTLAGPLRIDRLVIDHPAVLIEARSLAVNPELGELLAGRIELSELSAGSLEVTLREQEPQPPSEPHFLPRLLEIDARLVRARDVSVTLPAGQRIELDEIEATVGITRWRIDVPRFALRGDAGEVGGTIALRATLPLGIRSALEGHWRLPDGHDYRFTGSTRGKLDRLGVALGLSEPARLSFVGNLLVGPGGTGAVGTLRAEEFDGSPWLPAGRLPPMSGSIAIDAGSNAIGLDGTVSSSFFGSGPLRLQGGGRIDGRTLEIAGLRAWLPRLASELIAWGEVEFVEGAPRLDLQGEWTALQWPLSDSAIVESPFGTFRLEGGLPYRYQLQASTRGPQLPSAALEAGGVIEESALAVDSLKAAMLGGQLRGNGRLDWGGEQPWRFSIDGQELDLSKLRADLQGRVNIAGQAEGSGFSADGPWTARIDRLSGTLLGRPLTGRGSITHRSGSYDLDRIRVASGPSHVDVQGRWGPSVDLEWQANLESLGVVTAELGGSMTGRGTVRGPQAGPRIEGSVRARELAYGGLRADLANAEFDLDLGNSHPSRIDARIGDAAAGALEFSAITLHGEGPVDDHKFTIALTSPGSTDGRVAGFDAKLEAAGHTNVDERSWSGDIERIRVDFTDDTAELIQPVSLAISPDLLRSGPLCLVAGEARLCFEGEWQRTPGSWRGLFSAQDWPLKRLLRTFLGWREFDGKLQASGWVAREPGRDWVGGATVLLDEPTLDIPRNKFRSDRVRLGGGRLDLFADSTEIRGALDLELVEGTEVQGNITALRLDGHTLPDARLSGSLDLESTAITTLPLFVPEIDRADGRLDAGLRIGGTLAQPVFNGEFHLADARLDLYRTNLTLKNLALDGSFVGDQLTFSGRGDSGKGPLTLDGRFSWPDGVMTGSMRMQGEELLVADTPEYRVLASPDLTLRAGPDGYDVEGEVLIPRARISPKDLSSTVQTSPDERVVGLDEEDDSPSTLDRVRSRVRVTLGDSVTVDSYGLKARLGGDVTVTTKPDDIPRAKGAINVIEGQYKAFGQDVTITRGRLSYDNSALSDPALEIVAERVIRDEDITVAVNVRGRLAEPFITISSTPAMPSNQALSYLLTGRSIDTLQSNEATSVDRAAETLAISGGGLLLGTVGSRIGLDEVTVESRGTDDTEVVLGKYISPKLFVSYGISIVEAINTIKLRYTINSHWSLKAEAGLEQSADVEYRIER